MTLFLHLAEPKRLRSFSISATVCWLLTGLVYTQHNLFWLWSQVSQFVSFQFDVCALYSLICCLFVIWTASHSVSVYTVNCEIFSSQMNAPAMRCHNGPNATIKLYDAHSFRTSCSWIYIFFLVNELASHVRWAQKFYWAISIPAEVCVCVCALASGG